MEYQTLFVDIKQNIGIVWMNRPKLNNALNGTMIAELTAAMRALSDDPAVRAVVLAGAGESFCAGADMKWMQDMAVGSFKKNQTDAEKFATLLHTINTLKKPTIARVHGPVFADGIGLVAACDMAVSAYEAEFCLSEVRFGLIPMVTGPYVIRAMGERATRRYSYTAERFTAAEAYRIGLVSDIAPLEDLDARINELLGQLLQGGPIAQALSKHWIRMVAGVPAAPDLIKESAGYLAEMRASQEGREGILAFLEKREPAWLGQIKKTAVKKRATPKTRRKK
jgi:methylglutaconyl-CoA hydratase